MNKLMLVLVGGLTLGLSVSLARSQRVLTEPREIRKFLRYHPELTQELLIILAERPGTRISHATVEYIRVGRDSSEGSETCEIETTLTLTDGETLYDKVEVDKLCENIFK